MRKGKKDTNHDRVCADLRTMMYMVIEAHTVGPRAIPGFPDAIVYKAGWMRLIEIKQPGKREQLTKAEHAFRHQFGPMMLVVETADEVEEAFQKERDS